MRVLLLNAPVYLKSKPKKPELCTPALGILYIASMLESKGHEVSVIDVNISKISLAQLIREIEKFNPNIIGISSTTWSYHNALDIARALKNQFPEIIIVFGGPHASFEYLETLSHNYVDYVIRGEGELAMVELIEALLGKRKITEVKGLAFRKNGKIVLTDERPKIEHLDSLPHPAWHLLRKDLFDPERYIMGVVVTSRGCPFNCIFCSTSSFHGHKVRYHSISYVMEEIEIVSELFKRSARGMNFIFGDDTFTLNRKRAEQICEEMKKRGIDASFWCETRIDLINTRMLELLREAGCEVLLFGIESVTPEVLRVVGKNINMEKAVEMANISQKLGIAVDVSFIVGLPYETMDSVRNIKKFVERIEPHHVFIGPLMVLPGSPIYFNPQLYGITVLEESWGSIARKINNTMFDEEPHHHLNAIRTNWMNELEIMTVTDELNKWYAKRFITKLIFQTSS